MLRAAPGVAAFVLAWIATSVIGWRIAEVHLPLLKEVVVSLNLGETIPKVAVSVVSAAMAQLISGPIVQAFRERRDRSVKQFDHLWPHLSPVLRNGVDRSQKWSDDTRMFVLNGGSGLPLDSQLPDSYSRFNAAD